MSKNTLSKETINVLECDFPRKPANRADADRFGNQQRGNALLVMGRYRTEDEQDAFIRESFSMELPFASKVSV